MTKRRTGPPLYELIHTRPERSERHDAPAPRTAVPARVEPAEPGGSRIAPGRILAIPAGYAFVAGAIAVGLIAAAFVVGYRSAEQAVRAEFEAAWLSRVEQGGRADDPLMALAPGTIPDQDRTAAVTPNPQNPAGQAPSRTNQPTQAGGWGPVESDPRQPGRMYFVLMETRRDGAVRLANFLREEGLEAYVVPIKGKTNLRRVITLPALASSSLQDPMVAELKRKIEQAGLRWQLSGGHDNLSGAYIRTY